MIGKLYEPSLWQQRFHALTTHEALGAGAAGPGKTACLLADPISIMMVENARIAKRPELAALPDTELWDLINRNPLPPGGSTGWVLYLRRTSPMLTDTITKAGRLFRAIDSGVTYNGDQLMFTFSSGFRYQFGHCQHLKDYERYMSSEYVQINFDELVQMEQEQYEQIKTRARVVDETLAQFIRVRAMSNPVMNEDDGGDVVLSDPYWVRRYFVEPQMEVGLPDPDHARALVMGERLVVRKTEEYDGEKFEETRIYLPARLDDHPDKKYVARYKRKLVLSPPHIRKALLEGDWFVVRGAFFEEQWDPGIHIIRPFKIPKHWHVFRSMDWGYKTHGVVLWWAVDDDGNLICIRELTFRLKRVAEVAKQMESIETAMGQWGPNGSKITGPADTQLWEERGDKALPKAAEFAELGIRWAQADKSGGSRRRNAERIAGRMADHENGTVDPGIAWFSHCLGCIRTIPAIKADKNEINTPRKGGADHHYDATAYAVGYASRGGLPTPSEDRPRRIDSVSRGRYGYGQH